MFRDVIRRMGEIVTGTAVAVGTLNSGGEAPVANANTIASELNNTRSVVGEASGVVARPAIGAPMETYVVGEGDTLDTVAVKLGLQKRDLVGMNGMGAVDSQTLSPGQRLIIREFAGEAAASVSVSPEAEQVAKDIKIGVVDAETAKIRNWTGMTVQEVARSEPAVRSELTMVIDKLKTIGVSQAVLEYMRGIKIVGIKDKMNFTLSQERLIVLSEMDPFREMHEVVHVLTYVVDDKGNPIGLDEIVAAGTDDILSGISNYSGELGDGSVCGMTYGNFPYEKAAPMVRGLAERLKISPQELIVYLVEDGVSWRQISGADMTYDVFLLRLGERFGDKASGALADPLWQCKLPAN